jgi:hypothetical protein
MSMALAALIIALASFIWNIISTAYSWKFSKPDVKINANTKWTIGEGSRLIIDVQNRGGSAIAVETVNVYWWFVRGYGSRQWMRRLFRKHPRYSKPRALARSTNIPKLGPSFPSTIQAYHSQDWEFDADELIKDWRNASQWEGTGPRDFLIQARLSNGKKVSLKIGVSRVGLYAEFPPTEDGVAQHGSGRSRASHVDNLSDSSRETSGLGWPEGS